MYLMAKRYAHILQPEMRDAVAVLEGKAAAVLPTTGDISSKTLTVSGQSSSRYDRNELYEKVWTTPMQALAKEYGVSDVALAKTCKKLHVPVPGRGYWNKRAAQKPVPARPPLPENSSESLPALANIADAEEGRKKTVQSEKAGFSSKTESLGRHVK